MNTSTELLIMKDIKFVPFGVYTMRQLKEGEVLPEGAVNCSYDKGKPLPPRTIMEEVRYPDLNAQDVTFDQLTAFFLANPTEEARLRAHQIVCEFVNHSDGGGCAIFHNMFTIAKFINGQWEKGHIRVAFRSDLDKYILQDVLEARFAKRRARNRIVVNPLREATVA